MEQHLSGHKGKYVVIMLGKDYLIEGKVIDTMSGALVLERANGVNSYINIHHIVEFHVRPEAKA